MNNSNTNRSSRFDFHNATSQDANPPLRGAKGGVDANAKTYRPTRKPLQLIQII